jgi:hypothetical protein
MTATEWITHFERLPESERKALIQYILKLEKPWIPESFRRGMLQAELGEFVEMEIALTQSPPI